MDGQQAHIYFQWYKALVGAAYLLYRGGERSYALSRAWSYYAQPIIGTLWDEEAHPEAVATAHQLMGWLWWLRSLDDPEAFFKKLQSEAQSTYRLGWRTFKT
jgi:hypothetical protein